MLELIAAATVGYVFGTKAGRKRYEQINRAYHTVVESPATKRLILAGRKSLANKLNPDHGMKEIKSLNETTVILEPKNKYGE